MSRKPILKILFVLLSLSLAASSRTFGQAPQVESLSPASGPGDSSIEVTIRGRSFAEGATVALLLKKQKHPLIVRSPQISKRVELLGNYTSLETEGFAKELQLLDGLLYVALESGLWVIDVRNPERPLSIGVTATDGTMWGFSISGNYAYLATNEKGYRSGGLKIIDISDPERPRVVGWDLFPKAVSQMDSSGPILFIATSGVQIMDVSDPLYPEIIAQLNRPENPGSIVVRGNYAYMGEAMRGGLYVADIRDPRHPSLVGYSREAGTVRDMALGGDMLYLAGWYPKGIRIMDVSDAVQPALVGSYDRIDGQPRLFVRGGYLYAADEKSLKVLDVTKPRTPRLTAAYSIEKTFGVWVDERGYGYAAIGESGVRIIRLNDPVRDTHFTDSGTLRAVLPAGLLEGRYDIVVINPNGEEGSLEDAYGVE